MLRGPASGEIVVQADFNFLNLRFPGQKSIKSGRCFERAALFTFARGTDASQRQSVFVRSAFQRQMCKRLHGGFINCRPPAFSFGRKAEGIALVASRRFTFERFAQSAGPPQKNIPRDAAFVSADKHRVVVRRTLIQKPGPDAALDHPPVNPSLHQIGKDTPVIFRGGGKDKLSLRFCFGELCASGKGFFTQG